MSSDKIDVGLENPAYEGDSRDIETFPPAETVQDFTRESETGEVLGPYSPINADRNFLANAESSEENVLAQLNPEPVILPTTTSENSSIDINNTVTWVVAVSYACFQFSPRHITPSTWSLK